MKQLLKVEIGICKKKIKKIRLIPEQNIIFPSTHVLGNETLDSKHEHLAPTFKIEGMFECLSDV